MSKIFFFILSLTSIIWHIQPIFAMKRFAPQIAACAVRRGPSSASCSRRNLDHNLIHRTQKQNTFQTKRYLSEKAYTPRVISLSYPYNEQIVTQVARNGNLSEPNGLILKYTTIIPPSIENNQYQITWEREYEPEENYLGLLDNYFAFIDTMKVLFSNLLKDLPAPLKLHYSRILSDLYYQDLTNKYIEIRINTDFDCENSNNAITTVINLQQSNQKEAEDTYNEEANYHNTEDDRSFATKAFHKLLEFYIKSVMAFGIAAPIYSAYDFFNNL